MGEAVRVLGRESLSMIYFQLRVVFWRSVFDVLLLLLHALCGHSALFLSARSFIRKHTHPHRVRGWKEATARGRKVYTKSKRIFLKAGRGKCNINAICRRELFIILFSSNFVICSCRPGSAAIDSWILYKVSRSSKSSIWKFLKRWPSGCYEVSMLI